LLLIPALARVVLTSFDKHPDEVDEEGKDNETCDGKDI
jgi:hypothetical protein